MTIRARPTLSSVLLTVEDDGGGFRPEESDLLFDKFYRPGDAMHRSGTGQGLGLYIVRRLIELGKGKVRAHSDGIGRGARFEVSWPSVEGGGR